MGVTRWRRYGKDRLYVKDADGHDLGWWDLVANTGHPATPEIEALLLEVVTTWQTTIADSPIAAEPPVPVSTPVPGPEVLHRGPDFLALEVRPALHDWVDAPVVAEDPVVEAFAPPQGPPVVVDLVFNRPG